MKLILIISSFFNSIQQSLVTAKSSTDTILRSKAVALYRIPLDPRYFHWPWHLKLLASDFNGTVYQDYDDISSLSQKWRLISRFDNVFYIKNRATDLCLVANQDGIVITTPCKDEDFQKWELIHGRDWSYGRYFEWYWIKNLATKQLLDQNEKIIFTRKPNNGNSQKWHLYRCSDFLYKVYFIKKKYKISKHSI